MTTTDEQLAELRGVRLGARERKILRAAPPPHAAPGRRPALLTRSERMSWQRAARRLHELGLIEYAPTERRVRRTLLGQKVVDRYWKQLSLGGPIRWPRAPRRTTRAQRARLAELAAHVEQLCEEHAVTWVKPSPTSANPGHFYAHRDRRRIRSARIASRVDYFTALHELAHIVLDCGGDCESEADAWAWAIEHACVRPTQAVKADIRRSLRTYNDGRSEKPPREHVFWHLLEHGSNSAR